MTIGDKVRYGNLHGTIMLLVHPTMKAVIKFARNGTKRLVKLSDLKKEEVV